MTAVTAFPDPNPYTRIESWIWNRQHRQHSRHSRRAVDTGCRLASPFFARTTRKPSKKRDTDRRCFDVAEVVEVLEMPATRYTAASGRGCYRSSKSVGRRLVTAGALLASALETTLAERDREAQSELRDQISETRREIESSLADLSENLDKRLSGLGDMQTNISALDERLVRSGQLRDAGLEDLAARMGRIDEDVRFVLDRLNQLELRVQTGNLGGGGAGAAPIPDGGGAPRSAAWSGILPDLQSPNAGTRWQAVQALGETGDVGVVSHLIPMLKDVDIFVRMATARVMGDLDATTSIPHLVDALEDPEAAVQEAAVVSLRSITGRDFGFDFQANETARAKKVKAWRQWWDKAKDDFRSSRGSVRELPVSVARLSRLRRLHLPTDIAHTESRARGSPQDVFTVSGTAASARPHRSASSSTG